MVQAARQRVRLGLDERRDQLLALGRELFNSQSYDSISVDDIAKAAGISKGLLYHYFSSKRGFYVATVRASLEEMTRVTEPDPSLSPPYQLEASVDAYLDYVENNGVGFENLLRSGIGADPEVVAMIERQRELTVDRVFHGMNIEDPMPAYRTAVRAWVGFVDAACMDWVRGGYDVDRATMHALMINSLQSALLTAMYMNPDLRRQLPEIRPDATAADATVQIAQAVARANSPLA